MALGVKGRRQRGMFGGGRFPATHRRSRLARGRAPGVGVHPTATNEPPPRTPLRPPIEAAGGRAFAVLQDEQRDEQASWTTQIDHTASELAKLGAGPVFDGKAR